VGILDSNTVEQRTIEFIPLNERHGNVRSLITVWFSANMNMTSVVAGMLPIVFGLDIIWAIVAILVGNGVGTVFMAYHSAQGPKLGIPQMIQSRAQFGFYGAVAPLALCILMYLGFFSLGAVLGGNAVASLLNVSTVVGIIIMNAICLAVALFGYDLVHNLEKYAAIVFTVIFAVITVKLVSMGTPAPKEYTLDLATFLVAVSIPATWQIGYAPYVADYSRYLPEDTSVQKSFWFTYIGSFVGASWCMIMGSLAAWLTFDAATGNSTLFFSNLLGGGLQWLILLVIMLGIVGINTLNLYGPFMVSMTVLSSFATFKTKGPVLRLIITAICAVIGTVIAIYIKDSLVASFDAFLIFILYLLVPWTAINLMDFYVVRKGRYSIPDIFTPAGIYGTINWRTMLVYAVTLAIEIPFMSLPFYTGPIAPMIGGTDIAWIIGLVVPAILYYLVTGDLRRETEDLARAHKLTTGSGGTQYERPVAGAGAASA
jgi:nucleobase:cation symporter-1, NCS1 family